MCMSVSFYRKRELAEAYGIIVLSARSNSREMKANGDVIYI